MNGRGRLSLRARLLVVLIAVTAAFLVIMGGVTTFVLSKRLGDQFDAELQAAAQQSPFQIQSSPGDYVAVVVTFRPFVVHRLTGSSALTEELAGAVQRMIHTHTAGNYVTGTPFPVPGTSPRL